MITDLEQINTILTDFKICSPPSLIMNLISLSALMSRICARQSAYFRQNQKAETKKLCVIEIVNEGKLDTLFAANVTSNKCMNLWLM